MNTLETIFNRKSVRHFKNETVSREDLNTILKAGMAAASALNQQPWAFVAITAPETLHALGEKLPYSKMLLQASAAVVVCGDLERALKGRAQEFWVQDCSAASMNILLAVEALGLGAVWTAVYPDPEHIQAVRETLNLPPHILPLNVIPIGVPQGSDRPKDKWKPENIHWEKW